MNVDSADYTPSVFNAGIISVTDTPWQIVVTFCLIFPHSLGMTGLPLESQRVVGTGGNASSKAVVTDRFDVEGIQNGNGNLLNFAGSPSNDLEKV